MFTRQLYKHKDNVSAQLNAGISAVSTSIVLKTGEGALFPTTYSGAATSGGSATALNDTGIGASGIAVGDIVVNLTDGSHAVVVTVNTNDIVTTTLKGGTDNTWDNADVWIVNPFVVTLINYDTDGTTILKREKVLVNTRSSDTLTVNASGRGFDGSSAQTFSADDYVYLMWTSAADDGILEAISQMVRDIQTNATAIASLSSTKADDSSVVHDTGDETVAGVKTFSSFPVTPSSAPTTDYQTANKKYVDDNITTKFGGTGADGALTITSGTTTIDLAGARSVIKNYTTISITGTGALAFINPHANGTFITLKATGNVTLTSSATPMIDASGLGAEGGAAQTGNGVGGVGGTDGTNTFFLTKAGGGGSGTQGAAGALPILTVSSISATLYKYPMVFVGAGGGSGGASGGGSSTTGAGGRGGGCLIIETRGSYNFTTASGISVAGKNGGNASGYAGGGGGGGAGGFFLAIYATLVANSGTVTVSGGVVGSQTGGGNGGGGASGISAGSTSTGAAGYATATANTEYM